MDYLADTNVITRSVLEDDVLYQTIIGALNKLKANGDEVFICTQNLIEHRAVATRPLASNGLGLNAQEATVQTQRLKSYYPL